MKNQNHQHPSNFWFGFAIGGIVATGLSYLLGTKKGRAMARQLIDQAEDADLGPEEILSFIERFQNKDSENEGETHEHHSHEHEPEPESMEEAVPKNIDSIIEKMKSMTQSKKQVKKFFVKGGKVVSE